MKSFLTLQFPLLSLREPISRDYSGRDSPPRITR